MFALLITIKNSHHAHIFHLISQYRNISYRCNYSYYSSFNLNNRRKAQKLSKMYTQKFFYVAFTTSNGTSVKDLFMGSTPAEAKKTAKEANQFGKSFNAGKTAYNTLGEKM